MENRNAKRRAAAASAQPPHQEVAPPVPQNIQQQHQSSLNYAVPTEIVDLPSRGRFYPKDSPLYGKESIEIRYMTARDEDILTSPALLKKGVALDRLLDNVLMDNSFKSKDLLSGDRNALMYAVRITGYGSDYPAQVTCKGCGTEHVHDFDLSNFDEMYKNVSDEDIESVNLTDHGTFTYTLPKTRVTVEGKFISGHDEDRLINASQMKKKNKMLETQTTDLLRTIIISANGVTDPTELSDFINNMPAADSRALREVYAKIVPDVKFLEETTCPACGTEQEGDVPITTRFF